MTREDRIAIGTAITIVVGVIVVGWARGAFAGHKGTPGVPDPEPLDPPRPTPDAPTVAPERVEVPGSEVPPWLPIGGAPPSGREHLGWYTYKGRWIRVEGEHDIDSRPASSGHQHPHGFMWWAVYSSETPIAIARAWNEHASFDEDDNIDAAAAKAARWIDLPS